MASMNLIFIILSLNVYTCRWLGVIRLDNTDPCNLTHSLKNEVSCVQIIETELNYKNWPLGVLFSDLWQTYTVSCNHYYNQHIKCFHHSKKSSQDTSVVDRFSTSLASKTTDHISVTIVQCFLELQKWIPSMYNIVSGFFYIA